MGAMPVGVQVPPPVVEYGTNNMYRYKKLSAFFVFMKNIIVTNQPKNTQFLYISLNFILTKSYSFELSIRDMASEGGWPICLYYLLKCI